MPCYGHRTGNIKSGAYIGAHSHIHVYNGKSTPDANTSYKQNYVSMGNGFSVYHKPSAFYKPSKQITPEKIEFIDLDKNYSHNHQQNKNNQAQINYLKINQDYSISAKNKQAKIEKKQNELIDSILREKCVKPRQKIAIRVK